jgi:hypothetical protein
MGMSTMWSLRGKRLFYLALTLLATVTGMVQLSARPAYANSTQAGKATVMNGGTWYCDCTNGGDQCKCVVGN